MRVWLLNKNGTLEVQDRPEKVTEPMQVKVRISKVLLNASDRELLFGQNPQAVYPMIPGRNAVGILSESRDCDIPLSMGTRIYLHSAFPCGQCESCKSGDFLHCAHMRIAGVNTNGFFREFAVANLDDVTFLPSSVSDEAALYTEWIATAETVLDTLQVSKGAHVIVLGANLLGILFAQLLMYRQIVPILVDPDESRLAYARKCDLYYTFPCDETLFDNVSRVTGGRMADAAVHTLRDGIDYSLVSSLAAPYTPIVFAGFGANDLSVNLRGAMERKQSIFFVTDGKKHISSAINLLANKAVKMPDLQYRYFSPEEIMQNADRIAAEPADFRTPYIVRLL